MKKIPPTFFDHPIGGSDGHSKFDKLCIELNIQTSAGKIFLRHALENSCLMDGKQQDYGSKNISSFGMFGVVVRMSDKFERIKNLFNQKRKRSVNESIVDSFQDISNYAIIARMLHDKEWPSE